MENEKTVVESTEIISNADFVGVNALKELENPTSSFFCTIQDDGTRESKKTVYNAVNGDSEPLIEHIGEILSVVDVIAHPVPVVNEQTGEIGEAVRVVLVTEGGATYSCVSNGVVQSLQKMFAILGMPSWKDEPVDMVCRQKQSRNSNVNKYLTLELV